MRLIFLFVFHLFWVTQALNYGEDLFFSIQKFSVYRNNIDIITEIHNQYGESYNGVSDTSFSLYYKKRMYPTLEKKHEPILVNVIYDASASVKDAAEKMQDALKRIMAVFKSEDQFSLIAFNNTYTILSSYTEERALVENLTTGIEHHGSSLLYDTIDYCMDTMANQQLSKFILVISDGKDQAVKESRLRFSKKSAQDIVNRALKEDVHIFSVSASDDADMQVLNSLSEPTGGIAVDSAQKSFSVLYTRMAAMRKFVYRAVFEDPVREEIDYNRSVNINLNFAAKSNDINIIVHPALRMFEYRGDLFDNSLLLDSYRLLDAELISVDSTQYPKIEVVFVARDGQGKYINGIEDKNIEITLTIDWQKYMVKELKKKMSFAILVDKSGSMQQCYDAVKKSVWDIISKTEPHQQMSLALFDANYYIVKDYLTESLSMEKDFKSSEAKGPTALYDNVAKCAADLSHMSYPRGIILFTDGFDRRTEKSRIQMSSMTLTEAINYCYGTNIPVYCVESGESNKKVLNRLTGRTAGKLFQISEAAKAFDIISAHPPCQYGIAIVQPFSENREYELYLKLNYQGAQKEFRFDM